MQIKNLNNNPTLPPTDPETLAGVHMKVSKVCESFDESFVNQPYGIVRDRFVSDSPFDNYKSDICQHYTEYTKSLSHISENMPKISSFLQELGIILRENQVDVLERCKSIDSSIVDTNDFTTFLELVTKIKKPCRISDILEAINANPEILSLCSDSSVNNERLSSVFIANFETTLAQSLSSLTIKELHIVNNFMFNHAEVATLILKTHLLGLLGIVAYAHLHHSLSNSSILGDTINRITILKSGFMDRIANLFGLYNPNLLVYPKSLHNTIKYYCNFILSTSFGKFFVSFLEVVNRQIPFSVKIMLQNSGILSSKNDMQVCKLYKLNNRRESAWSHVQLIFSEDSTTSIRTISKVMVINSTNDELIDYTKQSEGKLCLDAFKLVKTLTILKKSSFLSKMKLSEFCAEAKKSDPRKIRQIFDFYRPGNKYWDTDDEMLLNRKLYGFLVKNVNFWSNDLNEGNFSVNRNNICCVYTTKSIDDITFFVRCTNVGYMNDIFISQLLVKMGPAERIINVSSLIDVLSKFKEYSKVPGMDLKTFCDFICEKPHRTKSLFGGDSAYRGF